MDRRQFLGLCFLTSAALATSGRAVAHGGLLAPRIRAALAAAPEGASARLWLRSSSDAIRRLRDERAVTGYPDARFDGVEIHFDDGERLRLPGNTPTGIRMEPWGRDGYFVETVEHPTAVAGASRGERYKQVLNWKNCAMGIDYVRSFDLILLGD